MKRMAYGLAAIAMLAATAGGADTNELAHPRKWTSASGAELMAIFESASNLADEYVFTRSWERVRHILLGPPG